MMARLTSSFDVIQTFYESLEPESVGKGGTAVITDDTGAHAHLGDPHQAPEGRRGADADSKVQRVLPFDQNYVTDKCKECAQSPLLVCLSFPLLFSGDTAEDPFLVVAAVCEEHVAGEQ